MRQQSGIKNQRTYNNEDAHLIPRKSKKASGNTGNKLYNTTVSENYLISFFSCSFLQLWENQIAVKGN